MFTARITFSYGDSTDREDLLESASSLLSVWYKNGQIVAPTWPMAEDPSEIHAYALIPDRDSLEEKHANRYVRERMEELREQAGAPLRVVLLGHDPESLEACSCEESPSFILFTTYSQLESPWRCGACFLPVPLYLFPHTHDEEYCDVLSWVADYRACDSLQMHCRVGERFGEQQLLRPGSALSRQGLEICRALEDKMGRKAYYYLHKSRGRSLATERRRRCPGCGGEWLLEEPWHGLFDFRCDACALLSNVACSLAV
jgi:predicted  nucleic acid-binding Zn ribbon protein